MLLSLSETIPRIFEQVQSSITNHRKNCATLYKIHINASSVIQNGKLAGEHSFAEIFLAMLSRVLTVKKGQTSPDHVIKFIGNYVQFLTHKSASSESRATSLKSDANGGSTLSDRFSTCLLSWILPGLSANDKTVRFRTTELIAELVAHLLDIE